MKMKFLPLVVGAIVAVLIGPLKAVEQKIRITGIYSGLYYNQDSGDLHGTELFIVFAGADDARYMALVQHWEGAAGVPILTPVKVDANKVTFSVSSRSDEGKQETYEGRISQTGFDGIWRYPDANGGFSEEPIHLKRKKSYWQ